MAHGGMVPPACPGCGESYADGGPVENPSITAEHSAGHHGLLGMMKEVGKGRLNKAEDHKAILKDAQDQHKWRERPVGPPVAKSPGQELGDHMANGDHASAGEMLSGHPLVGAKGKKELEPIMERMEAPMKSAEPHPEAFRNSVDYLHSSMLGQDKIKSHLSDFMNDKKMKHEPDTDSREELRKSVDEMQVDPNQALSIGGNLGHYLPEHGAAVGALSAQALNYLNSIKPQNSQGGPLDPVVPPSRMAMAKYNRALDLANNPLSVIAMAKNGTIQRQDMQALATMYPRLSQSIMQHATEMLVSGDTGLTRSQKRGLGNLLGTSLNFSETPLAFQAILQANTSFEVERDANGRTKKPTKIAVDQANEQAKLMATEPQKRQLDEK